jgi:hypothetical protein
MGHTLNLVAGILSSAERLEATGRAQAAIVLLQRLAGFRDLMPEIAEDVHCRLADLYASREEFKKARRHLAIAMTFHPQDAAYHHRMAWWIEADPDASIDRARRYYREAVRQDVDNATYWADYGAYLLQVGRIRSGRAALYRAFKLGSPDLAMVGRIVQALRDASLWDDARRLLRRARFHAGRDRRFAVLWEQHAFAQLAAQQAEGTNPTSCPALKAMVLPFLRVEPQAPTTIVDGKSA